VIRGVLADDQSLVRAGFRALLGAEPGVARRVVGAEAAEGAAALASRGKPLAGHGQKFTRKWEALIAALLTEPTHRAAAAKVGVGPSTLYRWLHLPDFRAAYRQQEQETDR